MFSARGMYRFVEDVYQKNDALGWATVGLLTLILCLLAYVVFREMAAYRRLGQCELLRDGACALRPTRATNRPRPS